MLRPNFSAFYENKCGSFESKKNKGKKTTFTAKRPKCLDEAKRYFLGRGMFRGSLGGTHGSLFFKIVHLVFSFWRFRFECLFIVTTMSLFLFEKGQVGWRFRLHWFLNQHVFIYGVVMHMWLFFFVDHEAKLVLSYRVLFEREVWMMLQILDSLSHLISDQLSSIKFWHNTNSCWMLLSNLIIYCPKQEHSAF